MRLELIGGRLAHELHGVAPFDQADAFPDREFSGSVTSISQSLGAARIATRGPRRPNDVEVVEVMVALEGNPPLFTGMRVDAFFKLETSASAVEPKAN